jgi:PAS domain S-box-containing protein
MGSTGRDGADRELPDQQLTALRASEQWFARFMGHLPGLAWIKDRAGRYVYVNDAAERAFQRPRAELYGQTDADVFPPETGREFSENDRRVLAGETVVELVEHLRHEDGVVHQSLVRKFPIPDDAGRVALVGGIAIDITAHRQTEAALRASEDRFRFLADTIPSIVWTAAPDGTITYANRRWFDYCGIPPQQNTREWPALALHPDDRERCIAQWTEALRDGNPYEIEVRHRRHDGAYRWFVTRAVPRRDAGGRVTAWFGVTTDIHDQKRLQEELRAADRRKDEFLATLAHELRNPLAPIRNVLQILRVSGAGLTHEMREMMERQVAHIVRLVDDLLELSRITSGKIELRRERVELADVLRGAIEASLPLIEAGGHQFTLHLSPEPLTLEADPVRLAQVVANLLNNAARFTDRGGQIWLSGRREDGAALISIRDTGKGIPADMLPRVFDIFVQADRSDGRTPEGLGIGLTLARSLVEKHGGRIEARSDGPGRGSEFIVTLPLAPSAAGAAAAPQADGRARGATIPSRVLVVDDNRDAADSLGMLLEVLGAETRVVYDGAAALRALPEHRPEILFLDLGMPEMDGEEVARRVRAAPEFRDTVLIAMTGWGQEEDRRRSESAGFDFHLVKPADIDVLHGLLSSLRGAAARRAAAGAERE